MKKTNFDLEEYSFQCSFCTETISVMLDPSEKDQQYIEDCEVCCNPIEITVKFSDGELIFFNSRATD